jgi:hypothetical protein
VATVASAHTSLWRVPLTGAEHRAGVPTELAANGAAPRLGPGLIAYLAAPGGRAGVWTLAGGVTREIWRGPPASILAAPAISPDGRRIVFKVALADESRLYVVNSDGSGARELVRGLELRGEAAWAPDGRSVLAAVMRAGEPRVMRVSLDDGRLLPLVPEYSLDPVWSPDGRYVVYSGADVGTTFPVRAAAADGRPYPLPGLMLTRGARRLAFLGGSQSLVLLRGGMGHRNLALFDLATGSERVLLELPPEFIVRDFDVAADGSELVLERVEEKSDLALIERQP